MILYPLKNIPATDAGWRKLVDRNLQRRRQAKLNRQLRARKSAAKSERPRRKRCGPKMTRKQRNAQRRPKCHN